MIAALLIVLLILLVADRCCVGQHYALCAGSRTDKGRCTCLDIWREHDTRWWTRPLQ